MSNTTKCGFCERGVMTKVTVDYAHKVGDKCKYCHGTGLAPMGGAERKGD